MTQAPLTPAVTPTVPTPTQGAGATLAASDKLQAARKAGQDFEALFLAQMMTHMFSGTDPNGMFGGGAGEAAWRGMLTQEYAKVMAKAGGVGVADAVVREMIQQQASK